MRSGSHRGEIPPRCAPLLKMKTLLENLVNGNLTDAKKQATRYDLFAIAKYAAEHLGCSRNKAIMAAAYLKGRATFQAYCDAI